MGGDRGSSDVYEKGKSKVADTGTSDLSKTVFLKRPNHTREREGDTNISESNAHTSGSTPNPVFNQDPTTTNTDIDTTHETTSGAIIFRDPMANPSDFEELMRSSRQQPNWKATVIEGESWEGSAEENIAKYQRVMRDTDGPTS